MISELQSISNVINNTGKEMHLQGCRSYITRYINSEAIEEFNSETTELTQTIKSAEDTSEIIQAVEDILGENYDNIFMQVPDDMMDPDTMMELQEKIIDNNVGVEISMLIDAPEYPLAAVAKWCFSNEAAEPESAHISVLNKLIYVYCKLDLLGYLSGLSIVQYIELVIYFSRNVLKLDMMQYR